MEKIIDDKTNKIYYEFLNKIDGKKLVCFGAGVCLYQFLSVYEGKIDLVIDNKRYGQKIYSRHGQIIVRPVDDIVDYSPDETVVLITCDAYTEMLTQIKRLGYLSVFVWQFIRNFEKNIYDEMSMYMINHEIGNLSKRGSLNIAHIAWHNGLNAGDHVLCHCVRKAFDFYFGECRFDLIHVHDVVTEELIDIINQHDVVIIGGGGLFLPNTNENNISGWQWACSKELMDKIVKPIIVFSVGYNYFYGQAPNDVFKNGLSVLKSNSDFFGLRNYGSIEKVKELVEDTDGIIYQPCVTTCINKYIEIRDDNYKTNRIAINLAMDYSDLRFMGEMDNIAEQVAMFCKSIQEEGYEINVTIHCYDDWKFTGYLYYYGVDFNIVDLVRKTPGEILGFYSEMGLVISSRGHGQMIPFGVGTPILALSTHPKCRYFIDDINAPESWFVDINDVKDIEKRLMQSFHEIMKDYEDNRKLIEVKKELLWTKTQDNFRIIDSIIKRNIVEDVN